MKRTVEYMIWRMSLYRHVHFDERYAAYLCSYEVISLLHGVLLNLAEDSVEDNKPFTMRDILLSICAGHESVKGKQGGYIGSKK